MKEKLKFTLPLLALRGMIIYPALPLQLDIVREKAIQAVEEAMRTDEKCLFAVTQSDLDIVDPIEEHLYSIGTIVTVEKIQRLPNGTIRVLLLGVERAMKVAYHDKGTFVSVDLETLPINKEITTAITVTMRTLIKHFKKYAELSQKIPPNWQSSLKIWENRNY